MSTDSRTVALGELQDEAFEALVRRGLRWRIYLGPPLFVLSVLVVAFDETPWRRWAIGLLLAAVALRAATQVRAIRREGLSEARVGALMSVPAMTLLGTVLLTGGVDSPAFPMVPLVGAFLALFLRPSLAVTWVVVSTALVWGLLALHLWGGVPNVVPTGFGGGAQVSPSGLLVARAVFLSVAVVWGALLGVLMRGAYRTALERALRARDEVLATHDEAAQQLTTLAGEIAHELKNPLASVKGLAALLERDVQGRAQERLTVLRREVDRMQDILQSFLNFSRPLVPLDAQPVLLKDVVEGVVALHEGLAREKGVTFNVEDWGPVQVRADPRKVKQVLINLVQNALDASPRGGVIDVLVTREGEVGARVQVRDRGPGVEEALRERLFEAGVTSKPQGSGLGLTVARLLARQHGGDVRLRARNDGPGVVAELSLPVELKGHAP